MAINKKPELCRKRSQPIENEVTVRPSESIAESAPQLPDPQLRSAGRCWGSLLDAKARSHRYGANHGLNRPLSAIVINAKAGMIE